MRVKTQTHNKIEKHMNHSQQRAQNGFLPLSRESDSLYNLFL